MSRRQYKKLIKEFHAYFSEDPEGRVVMGLETELEGFSEPTIEVQNIGIKQSKKLTSKMEKCPRKGLTFDENLDLDLALWILENDLFYSEMKFNDLCYLEQLPMGSDLSSGIYHLFLNDSLPVEQRLDTIVNKMETAPEYLDLHLETLVRPIRKWRDQDIEQMKELPVLFDGIHQWAEKENYRNLKGFEKAKTNLTGVMEDYVKRLKQKPTEKSFTIGEENAQRIINSNCINYSLDELRTIAEDFLAETREELAELRSKLVQHYGLPKNTTNVKLKSFLDKTYSVPFEKVFEAYHKETEDVIKHITDNGLFELPSDQEFSIIPTPKFLEHLLPVAAMDTPQPFGKGKKKSFFYVTLMKNNLLEHNLLTIPSLVVHEAVPGHHLQFATAYRNPSFIRKHIWAPEHAEGWTTMMEDYMLDRGYMGNRTDEARFIGKMELSRLGARVGIDLYFMTGDKKYLDVGVKCNFSSRNPLINARRLLKKVTGFTPARVETEVDWYCLYTGYPLSYLAGNHMAKQLKQDFVEAQRGKMSPVEMDKTFHKVYLESGCMPLKYLRKVYEHKGLIQKP